MSSRRGFLRDRIRQLGTGHVGLGLRPMSVNEGQVLTGQCGAPTGQSPKWGDFTFVPRVGPQRPPC